MTTDAGTITLEQTMEAIGVKGFITSGHQWHMRVLWTRLATENGASDPLAVPADVARAIAPELLAASRDAVTAHVAEHEWRLVRSLETLAAVRASAGKKAEGQEPSYEPSRDANVRGAVRMAEVGGVMDDATARLALTPPPKNLNELCVDYKEMPDAPHHALHPRDV